MELSPELKPYIDRAQTTPLTARMVAKMGRPLKTEGEVRPTDIAPVIAPDQTGKPAIYPMVWGFSNPRDGGKPLVNCRVETAGSKSFWKESWQRRRCIIPCSYYFEWEHYTTIKGERKAGQKYMIQPAGAVVTYLAGLYNIEEWDGMKYPVFTVLTREPGEEIRFIHNRMPVILGRENVKEWMDHEHDPKEVVRSSLTQMYCDLSGSYSVLLDSRAKHNHFNLDIIHTEVIEMKKIMIGLASLVLSMAVSAAVWAGPFDQYYDYENEEGTYSYYFTDGSSEQGIFVTMDKNWYQNTRVEIEDGGATFYHKDSYDAYAEKGLKGGRLFTIGACVNSDFRNLPSFEYIGFDENSCMNYYAELPTDYQAYAEDESIRAEYDSLWSGVKDVIAGIRIKGSSEEIEETEQVYVPDEVLPEVITSGDYEYTVNDDADTITISDYIGTDEEVEIPEEIDGYRVTDIGGQAFSYKKMKSLTFPSGIRSIGARAFEYCDIPEVTIPAGTTVETCAFGYCDNLRKVLIGQDAVIKSRAFGYCDDLETVVCAAGSKLEEDTFEYCRNLKKVILCGDVEVDEDAFYDCDHAEMIRAEESEYETWKQNDQETFSSDLESLLTGGRTETAETETLVAGEHRILLTGETDVFVDCPVKAKAGDLVSVSTVGVADGEVKLEVNGADIGKWENWGTYTFTMPD